MLNKVASSTAVGSGRNAVIQDIARAVETLEAGFGAEKLAGVGVGIPGYILMETGVVLGAPNLPEFENYPVRDEIEKRLGAKVILENDANAAVLGEQWMGAGTGVSDVVMLTLGTGIGGGIIMGGQIMRGYLGMAGEIGHTTISPNGYPCGCGNVGCFEKYASATAVSAMARLLNLGHDLSSLDVYNLAKGGNERARSIFVAVGTALGTGLANLINIFNFPLYLLGGGLTAAWDLFEAPMLEEIRRRSFSYRANSYRTKSPGIAAPRIERAALGPDAGLFGAARLPFMKGV